VIDGRLPPKDSCLKCLDGRDHPFHDNGDINEAWAFDGGLAAPTHIEETNSNMRDDGGTGVVRPDAPYPTPLGEFQIKDSGKRQEFEGGAMRDTEEGKIDYSNLIVHFEPMGTRFAMHMTKGRDKYPDPEPGVPNWTLFEATPENLARTLRSFDRHVKAYRAGLTDEDHASAILFNLNLAERIREQL
jgi:hypothetical protein